MKHIREVYGLTFIIIALILTTGCQNELEFMDDPLIGQKAIDADIPGLIDEGSIDEDESASSDDQIPNDGTTATDGNNQDGNQTNDGSGSTDGTAVSNDGGSNGEGSTTDGQDTGSVVDEGTGPTDADSTPSIPPIVVATATPLPVEDPSNTEPPADEDIADSGDQSTDDTSGNTDDGVASDDGSNSTDTDTDTGTDSGTDDGIVVADPEPEPTPIGPQFQDIVDEHIQKGVEEKGKTDILWVVDNSGSMEDEQQALADNFDIFIKDFVKQGIDFNMAITTTDTTRGMYGKMMNKGPLDALSAMENEAQFIENFKKWIKVGDPGSGHEKGLAAMKKFFELHKNFLRDDALLVVVVLSDEQDQSGHNVEKDYVQFVQGLKDNAGMAKIYSIVNPPNGIALKSFQNNWYFQSYWGNYINAMSGTRYIKASKLTGGLYADIKSDFHTILTDFGGEILILLDSFALSQKPYQNEFTVKVNGVEKTEGFIYNSTSRTISFQEGYIPSDGDIITIEYQVEVK